MENNNSTNVRVGFHSIEMLLKLSPENIKKIFVPANRNDDRVHGLIVMAEKLSVSVERKSLFYIERLWYSFGSEMYT